jgi:class 3 adenylate cyclase
LAVAELWITVRTPNRRTLHVLLDGPLTVGRDCDGLILVDQRVSRRHTSFEPLNESVLVTDLGSSNGTMVNGATIHEPTTVHPGDNVTVGNTSVTFQLSEHGTSWSSSPITELTTPTEPDLKTSIELVAESMEQDNERNAVAAEVVGVTNEPGTLTVMFSDIESSTELALAMGDTDWFALLGRHHQLVSTHVSAHRGRIVKNQGDGYMLCFRSAHQALLAGIGMQRDLARLGPSLLPDEPELEDGPRLRVRMGAHTGEVLMQDDGDLFGKHVIVAARVGALARGGQILVSSLLKQIAEPRGDVGFGPPFEATLKGIDGPSTIHEVAWDRYTSPT